MNAIEHSVTHHSQPTNNTCSQAALATLLSHYDIEMTPEEISEKMPVNLGPDGEPWGSINQQLATWCVGLGFDAQIYSADYEILDLSWVDLPKDKLLERLRAVVDKRDISTIGKEWSKVYTQSYIDFMTAGGDLTVVPYMSIALIDMLLEDSPILASVNDSVFRCSGRTTSVGLHDSKPDDIDGKIVNHSIVIYGKNDAGEYLVVDPWPVDTVHTITGDHLIAAMTAAQMECDNLLFQIKRKDAVDTVQ